MKTLKSVSLILLFFSLTTLTAAYKLPNASSSDADEDLITLQKISKGVASIANTASKGLVFVSVSKTIQGLPLGMVDPFEFFFGPQFRGGRKGKRPPHKQEGLGSGFFVDLKKGYILTNNHVIEGADEINLKLANGQTYEGKVLGRDKKTDVAVVQVKNPDFKRSGLAEIPLGNSDKVAVGDFVLALGAPFRLEASLSFGVVSALGRGNLEITDLGDFIQTDAAINPGNSGGPLLNVAGQAIGINTAIYSRSGGYNGIGFAIPANLARIVAEQLINGGKIERGYLGVALQRLSPELLEGLDLPDNTKGALIAKVVPDSPAGKAGIKAGDVVIKVDGRKVRSSSDLQNIIGLMKPNKKIRLTVIRSGKQRNINVKIGQWPSSDADYSGGTGAPKQTSDDFGLALSKVSRQLRAKYKFESKQGLVVTYVSPGSSADRAGLKPGDVILSANGAKISSKSDFKKAQKKRNRILLRIERAGDFFFVPLRKN